MVPLIITAESLITFSNAILNSRQAKASACRTPGDWSKVVFILTTLPGFEATRRWLIGRSMNWKGYDRKRSWPIEMLSRYFACRTEKSDESCWFDAEIRSKSLMNKTIAALTTLLVVLSTVCYIDVSTGMSQFL